MYKILAGIEASMDSHVFDAGHKTNIKIIVANRNKPRKDWNEI
ncbi:hypothetical protein [Peptostreptococcus anaerobius]|nr:hypothetical protein [Peptostreptococcus anaerobius]EKX94389.1 hypothetical protein HMPREF9998_00494 [Peptostreptococcus anaerobius VPI 4330 = DSM 2949]MDB8851629.1 hypothetical protein [Peptostreptococcus anaerobius]